MMPHPVIEIGYLEVRSLAVWDLGPAKWLNHCLHAVSTVFPQSFRCSLSNVRQPLQNLRRDYFPKCMFGEVTWTAAEQGGRLASWGADGVAGGAARGIGPGLEIERHVDCGKKRPACP